MAEPGAAKSARAAVDGPPDQDEARRAAEALRLPFDPLDAPPDDTDLWAEVPLDLLVRFVCVPVGRDGQRLVLAFGGLDDLRKVDEIEYLLARPVEPVVAPRQRVEEALEALSALETAP